MKRSNPVRQVEFIAHRGESADAPENTLAAFRLAWERGLPGIELDVHVTRDGHPVACHDPDTGRTTGESRVIAQTTLAELQTLDAGSWKSPRFASETLPTLGAVLATIPPGRRCFLEIKTGPESVPAVAGCIVASGLAPEQVAFISFYPETLTAIKAALPENRAYFLSAFKQDASGAWTPDAATLIQTAKALNADGLDLGVQGPVDAAFVRAVHEAGLEIYIWTVDEAGPAKALVAAGVDGITSNRADWLRKALAGQ